MANVNIYGEHRDILDLLITTAKTSSVAAATKTGPFSEQRDAYVFAASIAIALGTPTLPEKMPKSKQGVTSIHEKAIFGATGFEELTLAAAMTECSDDGSIEDSLAMQLDLIDDKQTADRFSLLDRYAHAGFAWLARYQSDEGSIRDLILSAIDQIECREHEVGDSSDVRDPLLDMLDMRI